MLQVAPMATTSIASVGYDRRPIVWDMEKHSQKIFDERLFSLDCVAAPNQYHFITGGESGELSVWNVSKKKPKIILENQHSTGWISSVAAVYNGDVAVSGAKDGQLVFYKGNFDNLKTLSLEPSFSLSCEGIINSIKFSPDERLMAVITGGESKLGRWFHSPVKSKLVLFQLEQ